MTTPSQPTPHNAASDAVRLNKRMAELGLCSRREADDWIDKGWVLVNGQPAQMGVKVTAADRIEVLPSAKGQQAQQVTILLHKPMGYVSGQAEDGHEPAITLIQARNHLVSDQGAFAEELAFAVLALTLLLVGVAVLSVVLSQSVNVGDGLA